jgi:hypothetical protein
LPAIPRDTWTTRPGASRRRTSRRSGQGDHGGDRADSEVHAAEATGGAVGDEPREVGESQGVDQAEAEGRNGEGNEDRRDVREDRGDREARPEREHAAEEGGQRPPRVQPFRGQHPGARHGSSRCRSKQ